VARGTSGLRGDFPFKHKAVAERVVLYRRRRTGLAWGLYRYGSRGDAEAMPDVTERFVELCDMPPDPLAAHVFDALDDAPTLASPLTRRKAPRRSHAKVTERKADRTWEQRAVVAEAIALERARALADLRATVALTQTLLRTEAIDDARPTGSDRRSDGPPPAFHPSYVRPHP